jgi:fatty acid desaturase
MESPARPDPEPKAPKSVKWYRTPVETQELKRLHERSDLRGFAQTLGYLLLLALTGSMAFFAAGRLPWPAVIALTFLHGTVFAFLLNGIHELGHGTVFRTKSLNALFDRILSFLAWVNFPMFEASHLRHHRYTLHPPDDLEVVLPLRVMIKHFFLQGFVNPVAAFKTLMGTVDVARGRLHANVAGAELSGDWIETLFPQSEPEKRRLPIRFARVILLGHGLIIAVSVWQQWWMLPVVTTLAPFYGSWLFFLCNNTQHIGLQDNVPDFRLCCRTFTMNPIVTFLYWHMNYHTEHHMYAAVPCYHLARLHAAIKHDLPPCPRGLIAIWLEIAAIQRRQKTEPEYQYSPPLPSSPASPAA